MLHIVRRQLLSIRIWLFLLQYHYEMLLQILGGTHFPFASLIRRHGCPSLFERIGMAVADKELPSFRCFLTITELKKASYIRAMSNIVKSAAVNSPPGDKEVNLCDGASARVGRSVSQPTRLML